MERPIIDILMNNFDYYKWNDNNENKFKSSNFNCFKV